jgi:hypothetical protein
VPAVTQWVEKSFSASASFELDFQIADETHTLFKKAKIKNTLSDSYRE